MTTRRKLMGTGATVMAAAAATGWWRRPARAASSSYGVNHSDAEWHALLTPDQYAVLREEGTERPFTSALLHEERRGTFACAGCNLDAFASTAKYDSHTGWPSFWEKLDGGVVTKQDTSFGMERTEVHCSRCGGHLGHVFDDGPRPTGLRYCMNGVAMTFKPAAA